MVERRTLLDLDVRIADAERRVQALHDAFPLARNRELAEEIVAVAERTLTLLRVHRHEMEKVLESLERSRSSLTRTEAVHR